MKRPASSQAPGALACLSAFERGLLAGVLLAERRADEGGGEPLAAETAIGGPARARLTEAEEQLRARPRDERVRWLSGVLDEVGAPAPPVLEEVHPEWIEEALSAASPRWWSSVLPWLSPAQQERVGTAAEGEPAGAPAIARGVLGVFTFAERGDGDDEEEPWLALSGEALANELLARGATAVGQALAGMDDAVLVRASAAFGEPWTTRVREAARGPVTPDARSRARACLLGLSSSPSAQATLLAVGATVVGAILSPGSSGIARRLAHRLPRVAGERLRKVAEGGLAALGEASPPLPAW